MYLCISQLDILGTAQVISNTPLIHAANKISIAQIFKDPKF